MMHRDHTIARLNDQIDELREQVRRLEEMNGMRFLAPPSFGLSRSQSIGFGMLLKHRMCTREALMFALYQGRNDVEVKTIDVHVCHLRRKLGPLGIDVKTQWGQGFCLTAEQKAAASALLEKANAA